METRRLFRLASVSLLAVAALAARAESNFGLRALGVASGFTPNTAPGPLDQKYEDRFDNGNPLVGPAYQNGVTGTGAYAVYGTPSPGVESSGVVSAGAGRLLFQRGDALPNPSNLDAPGTMSVAERFGLVNLTPSLLTAQTSFEVSTYWDFVLPDAGTSYGMRLSDNPFLVITAGTPFDDLLEMRVVRSNLGTPLVQLRRVTFDGVATLTVPELYAFDPAVALTAGHTLGEVAFIGLEAHYNAPSAASGPTMLWSFYLVDASGDNVLGKGTFGQRPSLFHGETTTRLFANAGWTVPVPEPGTWALMVAGLAGMAWRLRSRPATPQ